MPVHNRRSLVNGIRTQKTVNGTVTNYNYHGSALISQVTGNDTLLFSYDASGNVVSVDFNGMEYYYLRNAQGDIVKLIDASGASVVEYTYDTWGKEVQTTGSLAGTLGSFQPFRYRGYVYDEETGLYYLQSRYYDPTTGRFISADTLLSTGQGVLGHNCYAYCRDNPSSRFDPSGTEDKKTVIIFFTSYPESETSEEGDFKAQAEFYKKKLEDEGYVVELIEKNTATDFRDSWNDLKGSYSRVYIFCHSNGMSLIFQDGHGIGATGKNRDGTPSMGGAISELTPVQIDALYLMCCNAGHLGLYKEKGINVASAFYDLGSIAKVHAYDGNMAFGNGEDDNYDDRLSNTQWSYRTMYSKFGLSFWKNFFSKPKGWVTYPQKKE